METSDKDKRKLGKRKWGKWGHFMKLTLAQVLGLVYSAGSQPWLHTGA